MTTSTAPRSSTLPDWVGVATGPLAWTLHLWFNYGLEEFVACTPGARGRPDFLGIGTPAWVVLSNALLSLLVLGVGLFCLARYRRLRGADPSPGKRAEWMALSGVMLNALFLIVILSGVAPGLLLHACARSP